MKKYSIYIFCIVALAAFAVWAPKADAFSGYYTEKSCSGCHGSTVQTCNGCHAHGTHSKPGGSTINIRATPDKDVYAPGETVTVTLDGGSSQGGWIRAKLFDQDCSAVDCDTSVSGDDVIDVVYQARYPVTNLTGIAPSEAGQVTWSASWYGNAYDAVSKGPSWIPDLSNSGSPHGDEIVTFTFEVAAANSPPTANPNGPYEGTVGTAVSFNGTASIDSDGNIVSYNWAFGDGTSGTGPTPDHTYMTDGTFTVILTVTDNDGATDSASTTAVIGLGNQPPVADPKGPYNGTINAAVSFDGSASSDPDGTIASYNWDFGDGSTGTGPTPVHTYLTVGVFDVTLTVTDEDGASDSATTTATIAQGNQAPNADAGGPYEGMPGVEVAFDGSASNDPDGNIVSYSWDFGDGNTGTGPTPVHTYLTEGNFNVTLTVTDNNDATDSASTTATIASEPVNLPPVANANGPDTGTVGVVVSFDGSASSDPDGSITAYNWDFGDGGTGTGPTPGHTYASEGPFEVTLTVTDNNGETGTDTTSVTIGPADANLPPVADIGGPYNGTMGVSVSFDGSASHDPDGTIAAYDWDFGDGGTAAGPTPVHTYTQDGTYEVTLVVTDNEDATDSATMTIVIGVGNQAPVADHGGPYKGMVSVDVSCDGSASHDPDGSIVAYDWNFGDGSQGSGPTPIHSYANAGMFNVTLTVTDDEGTTDSATTTVTIINGDQPPVDRASDEYVEDDELESEHEYEREENHRRGDSYRSYDKKIKKYRSEEKDRPERD